jgi:hypothetical protein
MIRTINFDIMVMKDKKLSWFANLLLHQLVVTTVAAAEADNSSTFVHDTNVIIYAACLKNQHCLACLSSFSTRRRRILTVIVRPRVAHRPVPLTRSGRRSRIVPLHPEPRRLFLGQLVGHLGGGTRLGPAVLTLQKESLRNLSMINKMLKYDKAAEMLKRRVGGKRVYVLKIVEFHTC